VLHESSARLGAREDMDATSLPRKEKTDLI